MLPAFRSAGQVGTVEHEEPTAHGVGTTVTVANLFAALPVRHRELQGSLKTQARGG